MPNLGETCAPIGPAPRTIWVELPEAHAGFLAHGATQLALGRRCMRGVACSREDLQFWLS
eukprot:1142462-Pelagomonas_calceolata.AAC.2